MDQWTFILKSELSEVIKAVKWNNLNNCEQRCIYKYVYFLHLNIKYVNCFNRTSFKCKDII